MSHTKSRPEATNPNSLLRPKPAPMTGHSISLIKVIKVSQATLKKTPSIPPPIALAPPPPPTVANKLFMVKNGEMKPIKQSNISSSGILYPLKSVNEKRAPALRPLRPKFIINNEISGGVMTMEEYRRKVLNHKKDQLSQKAVAPSADPVTIYNVIRPGDLDLDSTVEFAHVAKNKPGRRPGFVVLKPKEDENAEMEKAPGSLTRSGRLSRPPRYYQRFYTKDNTQELAQLQPLSDAESPEPPPLPKRRRGPADRFKCEKCGRVYWTDLKLKRHIAVVHEGAADNDSPQIDCFNYFLGKLKKVPMNLRGKIFLDEMEIFVEKIQRLMQKLIRRFEETRLKDSFLNYSQVHQIPKVIEAVLNVEAGQYHFNTEIIDADEKTILGGDGDVAENGNGGGGGGSYQQQQHKDQLGLLVASSSSGVGDSGGQMLTMEKMGLGESALSGFDDSSTQPPIANDDIQKGFSDHIISLDDSIYDSVIPSSNEASLAAQPGGGGGGERDYYDDYAEDDDDLTTPKKDPFPSPSLRRMRKVKRTIKNLNKSESFAPPNIPLFSGAIVHQFGTANQPIIRDLSLELFQCRGSGGDGTGGSNIG